jgi:hypothetical protein
LGRIPTKIDNSESKLADIGKVLLKVLLVVGQLILLVAGGYVGLHKLLKTRHQFLATQASSERATLFEIRIFPPCRGFDLSNEKLWSSANDDCPTRARPPKAMHIA